MAARSMFARPGADNQAAQTPKGHLVEYRAGRMTVEGSTVTADKRKGLIIIKKSQDGLINFIWKDRSTNEESEPIILFPEDAIFHKCKSCKDGRVYYLRFSTGRREFFWMQEPDEKKDNAFSKKVNNIINNRPVDAMAVDDEAEVTSIAQQVSETPAASRANQGVTATPAVSATPAVPPALARPGAAAAPAARPIPQLDDNVLRGIMAGLAAQMPAVRQGQDGVDLSDIIKPETIEPLLQDPEVVERLRPFLPEGNNVSAQDIRENVLSPQFHQALASFSHALRTGQLDEVIAQFGVDAATARANGGGIVGLCRAIIAKKKQDSDRMDES